MLLTKFLLYSKSLACKGIEVIGECRYSDLGCEERKLVKDGRGKSIEHPAHYRATSGVQLLGLDDAESGPPKPFRTVSGLFSHKRSEPRSSNRFLLSSPQSSPI